MDTKTGTYTAGGYSTGTTGAGYAGALRVTFDGDALAQDVHGRVKAAADAIPALLSSDYEEYRANIKPGDTLREKGDILMTEAGRAALRQRCDEAAAEVDRLCDEAEAAARTEMTEAPGEAALSYARALSGRAGVTVDEVAEAFRRYGDNWTVFQILRGVVQEQRGAGNRDFYRLEPKNTLDNWQEKVKNIRREAKTFLDYLARQQYRDAETLSRRMDQLSLCLRYIGQGTAHGRPLGGGANPGWTTFANSRLSVGF